MNLTTHQQDKANGVIDLFRKHNRVLLKGSAGVGKTFLANYLIGELARKLHPGKKIYVSAPTNKAVAVIKNKVTELADLEFITTHSALKMRRQIDKNSGEVTFRSYANPKYPPLKGVGLLVVDEVSMLNTYMQQKLEEYATNQGVKVLFIGDDKQLNPVGEKDSPVFLGKPYMFTDEEKAIEFHKKAPKDSTLSKRNDDTYIVYVPYPTVELTEIIRQGAGNPIIDLSRNLKKIWSKVPQRTEQGGYIYTLDLPKIIGTLADVNGTDELKYLAWTNVAVNTMNKQVRHTLYGDKPNLIEKDETLIFNAPYGLNGEGSSIYYTNEEVKVEQLEVFTEKFMWPVKSNKVTGEFELNPIYLKVYSVNPGQKGLVNGILVVHEDSLDDYKKILKQMRVNAKARVLEWTDFFGFTEQFADTTYNHAITVHKSQGSTYKQVILNVRDMNRNRSTEEKQRLFYTGITRASDLLILYKA